jgi:hypothetical protein
MFEQYRQVIKQYPKLPLHDERKLIRLAKRGNYSAQQRLLLHQIGFSVYEFMAKYKQKGVPCLFGKKPLPRSGGEAGIRTLGTH